MFDAGDGVKYSHQSLLVLFLVVGFRIKPAFTHRFDFFRKLSAGCFGGEKFFEGTIAVNDLVELDDVEQVELGQKFEQVFEELKTMQLSVRSQEVDILNKFLSYLPRLQGQAERVESFDPNDCLAFEGKDPFKSGRVRRKNQPKRVFCRQLEDTILEQTA